MDLIHDITIANWIKANRGPTSPIPALYTGYCKIFHPVYEDLSVADRTITWDQDAKKSLALRGKDYSEGVPELTLARGFPEPGFPRRRIPWRRLAERYGLEFHPEMDEWAFHRIFPRSWPRYLAGPTQGTLERDSARRVVEVLRPFTRDQVCYFLFETVFEGSAVYEAALDEAPEIADPTDAPRLTPKGATLYWWPADRSWCVCTNRDLVYTFVGGPPTLIDAFLDDPILECVPVDPLLSPRSGDDPGRGHQP